MAERLQFHLDRKDLPDEATDLVRIAQAALAEAVGRAREFREEPLLCPCVCKWNPCPPCLPHQAMKGSRDPVPPCHLGAGFSFG